MSDYIETQRQLAESEAGKLAITMIPGTRWLTPEGATVTIWQGWTPDVEGYALTASKRYAWAMPGPDFNTTIGITHPSAPRTRRIKIAHVATWRKVG